MKKINKNLKKIRHMMQEAFLEGYACAEEEVAKNYLEEETVFDVEGTLIVGNGGELIFSEFVNKDDLIETCTQKAKEAYERDGSRAELIYFTVSPVLHEQHSPNKELFRIEFNYR